MTPGEPLPSELACAAGDDRAVRGADSCPTCCCRLVQYKTSTPALAIYNRFALRSLAADEPSGRFNNNYYVNPAPFLPTSTFILPSRPPISTSESSNSSPASSPSPILSTPSHAHSNPAEMFSSWLSPGPSSPTIIRPSPLLEIEADEEGNEVPIEWEDPRIQSWSGEERAENWEWFEKAVEVHKGIAALEVGRNAASGSDLSPCPCPLTTDSLVACIPRSSPTHLRTSLNPPPPGSIFLIILNINIRTHRHTSTSLRSHTIFFHLSKCAPNLLCVSYPLLSRRFPGPNHLRVPMTPSTSR
jgi:hypothetical protein